MDLWTTAGRWIPGHKSESKKTEQHGKPSLAVAVTMWVTVLLPYIGLGIAVAFAVSGGIAWIDLVVMAICYLAVGFGVTIGYHRLLTHRAFATTRWIEAIFYILGCMAAQGPPVRWAATHRRHHQNSDDHGDPHSPNLHDGGPAGILRGLWHAHTGWLLHRDPVDVGRSVKDLVASPVVRFVDRLYGFWILLGVLIPFAIGYIVKDSFTGGLVTMFWGAVVRVVLMHHATWSVNSVCHVFGYRTFKSGDESRNNPVIAALALGEGWHNNHHAFPTSAKHGLKKHEIDLSYLVIRAMERAKLVWNVRRPSLAALQVKAIEASAA